MSTIHVLCRFPNMSKELSAALPHLKFKDLISGIEGVNKEEHYGGFLEKSKACARELQEAEIIVADFDLLVPHINNLPKTKWIQGTWAGADSLVKHIDPNKIDSLPLVTRFSGKYFGLLMSEYTIAQIVNHERDFFKVYENQKKKQWDWSGTIFYYRSIADLTIGILGVGHIGSQIGRTLNNLGATVLGFGRQSNRDLSEMKFFSEYHSRETFPAFLKKVDYIVNVLPSTPETVGLLNGDILKNCKEKRPVFINIGRGTIISENDLISALNNKWLSAAVLDVFAEEPLPESSPLWTMSQVKITPHVSGVTRAQDVVEQFKENYKLFQENKPLSTAIDFRRGY